MKDEILTIDEAADYLQIGKRSLYRLVREGKIPGRKIMSRWRFERESLRKWVAFSETETKSASDRRRFAEIS